MPRHRPTAASARLVRLVAPPVVAALAACAGPGGAPSPAAQVQRQANGLADMLGALGSAIGAPAGTTAAGRAPSAVRRSP